MSSLQNDLGCLIKLWIPGPRLRGPERGLAVGAGTCAFRQQHRRGRSQADKLRTMLTRTYTAHLEFWLKASPLSPSQTCWVRVPEQRPEKPCSNQHVGDPRAGVSSLPLALCLEAPLSELCSGSAHLHPSRSHSFSLSRHFLLCVGRPCTLAFTSLALQACRCTSSWRRNTFLCKHVLRSRIPLAVFYPPKSCLPSTQFFNLSSMGNKDTSVF